MIVRNIIGTMIVLAIALAFMFAPSKFRSLRQSRQIKNEVAWIQNAVLQIQNSPAPPSEVMRSASTGRWEVATSTANYLIFSNGWGIYERHSWHADDGMDDMAVLKMPDGCFYLSRYHFETGIQAETHTRHDSKQESHRQSYNTQASSESGDPSQPSDGIDFLENGARWQGWYLFSRDGKLQCIVRSPYDDHRRDKKGLWVWIGIVDGTSSKTLFQKSYSILAGREMSWIAKWSSADEIVLQVFDYFGRSPMMMSQDLPARPLITLAFRRNQQNGLFLEKTNVSEISPNSQ